MIKWLGLLTVTVIGVTVYWSFSSPEKEIAPPPNEVTLHPFPPTTSAAPLAPATKRETSSVPSPPLRLKFQKLLSLTQIALPTRQTLTRVTPDDAHGHPQSLRDGAMRLGEIAQQLHDDPSLISAAIPFYQRCALRDDLPKSIRALCYSDVTRYHGADESFVTSVPVDVRELSGERKSRPE